ncbi:MAG: triose-phosphate isomerase [Candidatus Marinimicrobia bacterium]|nr:triose-phosphate isomerase [Candidatus Neomarinimicrobiota bacterium]
MRKLFIAGNWKMNHTATQTEDFCRELKAKGLEDHNVDILLCPPYTSIHAMVSVLGDTPLQVGAQNLHKKDSGAFTAEISADMITDSGCSHVLIGHSERRQYFHENDEGVNAKLKKALEKDLLPVVCIGESKDEREKDITEKIVRKQLLGALEGLTAEDLKKVTIAYEPVWAIGTGLTASPEQAQEVHRFIRKTLAENVNKELAAGVRVLYGGSAKPANAKELLSQEDIDGLLIGGASLKVGDFYEIIEIADKINK